MTEELFNAIVQWQDETFPRSTAHSKVLHLKEEVEELLVDVSIHNRDPKHEFADCLFLLFGAAHKLGMTYTDLQNALQEKFEINKGRTWDVDTQTNVYKHVTNPA